jgi:hypothetical protein
MKPEWAKARTDPRTVDLSDEVAEVFTVYLHWLYFKTIPTIDTERADIFPDYTLLGRCYVMGEKIMDNGIKNAIIASLVDIKDNRQSLGPPGSPILQVIYAGTTNGSHVRRFLVDMWVKDVQVSWVEHLTEPLPHECVLEFSRALLLSKCEPKRDKRTWKERVKDYLE